MACNNDIERAERLYEFFVKDLKSLPDFDLVPPTAFDQAKELITNTFSWIDNNQDKLVNYYNIIQQMRGGTPLSMPTQPMPDVPPIPNE